MRIFKNTGRPSKLSEEPRVAFMPTRVESKKNEEIAELLGITHKVVEYRT